MLKNSSKISDLPAFQRGRRVKVIQEDLETYPLSRFSLGDLRLLQQFHKKRYISLDDFHRLLELYEKVKHNADDIVSALEKLKSPE